MKRIRVCYRIPRHLRSLVVILSVLLLIACLVTPIYVTYREERNANPKNSLFLAASDENRVQVNISVASVDAAARLMKLKVRFEPQGRYGRDEPRRFPSRSLNLSDTGPQVGLTVHLGDQGSVSFQQGDVMKPTVVEVPLNDGDVNSFPFDEYASQLTVSAAFTGLPAELTAVNPKVQLQVGSVVQGFSIILTPYQFDNAPDVYMVGFTVRRAQTTKFFTMFIFLLMWCLSLSALGIAVDVVMRKRKLDPPILAIFSSLIFALPALRNAIPGAPVVGSDIDSLGFFWNMVLVATSALMMFWIYVLKYEDEKMRQRRLQLEQAIRASRVMNDTTPSLIKTDGASHLVSITQPLQTPVIGMNNESWVRYTDISSPPNRPPRTDTEDLSSKV